MWDVIKHAFCKYVLAYLLGLGVMGLVFFVTSLLNQLLSVNLIASVLIVACVAIALVDWLFVGMPNTGIRTLLCSSLFFATVIMAFYVMNIANGYWVIKGWVAIAIVLLPWAWTVKISASDCYERFRQSMRQIS